jgi:hypothetical protein
MSPVKKGMSMALTYNSLSPVLKYNTGLRYGQLLNGSTMARARVKSGVSYLTIAGLIQFLKNLITAATGNVNLPTPTPSLAALQTLVDDGETKINAVEAADDHGAMLRADRDEHLEKIRVAIAQFIAHAEAATTFDAVKLQSLGLAIRSPGTPLQPCDTLLGLVASVGDNEQEMRVKWPKQGQADSYEVQSSPDPLTPTSWVFAVNVSTPGTKLTGLTSGQKRWVRARAINRFGPGAWSDPACRMVP